MVSFILCLLPALLATTSAQGQSKTCKQCSGSADSCQPPAGTCPVTAGTGGCITVVEENTLSGTKATGLSRSCIADYNSGIKKPVTYSAGNGMYLRINVALCNDKDECNSGTPEVPTGSTTKNGLQCPTCFALNSDPCNSAITPCTGEETFCIDFAGTLKKGTDISTFVAKGCATESVQGIKPGTELASGVYTYTLTKATSKAAEKITITIPPTTTTKPTPATTSGASPALGKFSFALYLPGLTGLLLVKLLS